MKKIYIDAGHGGRDPGAQGYGLVEKDVTLKIAKWTMYYLQHSYTGHKVKMSRMHDTYPTLTERTDEANHWGADVFLSIHVNAGGGSGFESYVYPGVSRRTLTYQDCMHSDLMQSVYHDLPDRGQKQANLHVCRESRMPAVLTENLFIDTKKDAEFLMLESNLKKIGWAHSVGVAEFLDLKPKKHEHYQSNHLYHVQVGAFAKKENADRMAKRLKQDGYSTYIIRD